MSFQQKETDKLLILNLDDIPTKLYHNLTSLHLQFNFGITYILHRPKPDISPGSGARGTRRLWGRWGHKALEGQAIVYEQLAAGGASRRGI